MRLVPPCPSSMPLLTPNRPSSHFLLSFARRPYKLMEVIQRREDTHGARAACFFLALSFFLSQLCVNIAGNAITGGIDLATLFPKYINVRRGPYIVAVIGFAMNPWQLIYVRLRSLVAPTTIRDTDRPFVSLSLV